MRRCDPHQKEEKLIQWSNCKQCGHKKLRCAQVTASSNKVVDEKKDKEVEEVKKSFYKKINEIFLQYECYFDFCPVWF